MTPIYPVPDWQNTRSLIDSERYRERPTYQPTLRERLRQEMDAREIERRAAVARAKRRKREHRRVMWNQYRPAVYVAAGIGLVLLGLVNW